MNRPLEIYEKLRLQDVNRWGIVATQRPQSVAEHTLNVVFIIQELCSQIDTVKHDIRTPFLLQAALEHDIYEVKTGDIPTPAKEQMKQLEFDADALEGPKPWCDQLNDKEYQLLKAADLMESIHFLYNFGAGHRAETVEEDLKLKLKERSDWFTENQMEDIEDVIFTIMMALLDNCGEL